MRLRFSRELVLVICVVLLAWGAAEAHFGMIIPSDEMVMKGESNNVSLQLMFWHGGVSLRSALMIAR